MSRSGAPPGVWAQAGGRRGLFDLVMIPGWLSDPVPLSQLPALEERMDDARAVMDAAGSERAALLDVSEGGATASRGGVVQVRGSICFRQDGLPPDRAPALCSGIPSKAWPEVRA